MLEFRITGGTSSISSPEVLIDDVAFEERTYISATVAFHNGANKGATGKAASLAQLHAYDAQGHHTGPTSDSTWVEEIPGSRYYPYGSTEQAAAITLPESAGEGTYTFKIKPSETGNFIDLQIDEVRNDDRTATALFAEVALVPDAVASVSMSSLTPLIDLQIDANGDGRTDATVEHSAYIEEYIVEASAGPNGQISPAGINVAGRGDTLDFTITPSEGHVIADVLVDSISVGAISSYTLKGVSSDHTINAVFSATSTSLAEDSELPEAFVLRQNYPNPFNPATTIAYDVANPSDVRLVVHDLLGREVAVLVDEHQTAGRYEVTFDANGLASGVYLYTLRAGDFTQTRRLVLLK